jgi:hypothetical protein
VSQIDKLLISLLVLCSFTARAQYTTGTLSTTPFSPVGGVNLATDYYNTRFGLPTQAELLQLQKGPYAAVNPYAPQVVMQLQRNPLPPVVQVANQPQDNNNSLLPLIAAMAPALGKMGGPSRAPSTATTNATAADASVASPGMAGCSSSAVINKNMQNQYNSCLAAEKGPSKFVANSKDKPAFLVDADSKTAFLMDPNGNVKTCYNVTIGAASDNGAGKPATLGYGQDGCNLSNPGLYSTAVQKGDKCTVFITCDPGSQVTCINKNTGALENHTCQSMCYQGSDSCKPDAIKIDGADGGRLIHDAAGGKTTEGCIGIQDGRFEELKKQLGTDGANIFVWSSTYKGCGRSCPAPASDGSSPTVNTAK